MFALLATAAATAAEPVALSGRAMGTTWSVKFVQPATPLDHDVIARRVAGRLEQLEQQFSTYRATSDLSRFNATESTEWIPVSPELARVALESRGISELTGGAFDVTVYPLVHLWGFGPQRRTGALPRDSEIAVARERVDWRRLESRLDSPALRKTRAGVSVDFSSMAKGFAADAVSEFLVAFGAVNHFVQIGGDVKTGGHAAGGQPWRAAIEEPREDERSIARIVELSGQALSTSGDYRNYFVANGRRYGHIIDPRTGWPAASALASVSVVHASCATSSALATALFVLGPDEGFRLATRERLACLFVTRNGDRLVQRATPDFETLVR